MSDESDLKALGRKLVGALRQSIAEVGDFEIQMFNLAIRFNSST